MAEWQRLLRRVRELINPPRYPEYQEYRDEGDASGYLPGAVPSIGAGDETAVKMRRVQMVAALAIVLSIGGGAWFYYFDRTDPSAPDPRLREALANEVLKTDVDPTVTPPKDSLDDIKRWATDLERQMERGYDSTAATPFPVGGARPLAPYYGQGYDASQPLVLPDASLTYTETGTDRSIGGPPSSSAGPVVSPAAGPPRVEPTPRPLQTPAPTTAPAAGSQDRGTRTDSPDRPYQRRSLEPITYEPQTVEPY